VRHLKGGAAVSQRDGPDVSDLLTFGMSIAACLVAGLGVGWLVDTALETLPVFTLIGLALGIVATGLYIYAKLNKYLKE
jgi:F0F1-type ATP synthase assembly protein I